ncbi:MAG TPA: hypothetical protein VFK37_07860 [Bacillales bacterium]|nr:hypothetical protein [Bacillales bacterium]
MERNLYADHLQADHLPVLEQKAESREPAVRPRGSKEDQIVKMDTVEFLAMAGGGVILGVGIYFLSFLG